MKVSLAVCQRRVPWQLANRLDNLLVTCFKCPMRSQSSAIARLNDRFRQGDSSLGLWVTTASIEALLGNQKQALIRVVQDYDHFTEDSDPYGEHDFGIVHQDEVEYFWIIDCYDKDLKYLAADPTDQTTIRVLTLTRADEYYDAPVTPLCLIPFESLQ